MSAESIKEIVVRFIKSGVISDDDKNMLEKTFESSGFDTVTFSDDEKKEIGKETIKILEECGITMTANDSDEITVKISGKNDMTYNVNTEAKTNNMPATATPTKAAIPPAAKKPAFGSTSNRFGGKRTRKQKGGDPATIAVFAVFGALYLLSCVFGFKDDIFRFKALCASPIVAVVGIPMMIYDVLRNKGNDDTASNGAVDETISQGATDVDVTNGKVNATSNTNNNVITGVELSGVNLIEPSPFKTKMSFGGRKSRRTKTRKQKRRRNKK
jgi:hypothetical protein